jgi:hypothetical protein
MRNIDLNTPDPGELDPGRRAAPAHDTSANLPSLEIKRKDDYSHTIFAEIAPIVTPP